MNFHRYALQMLCSLMLLVSFSAQAQENSWIWDEQGQQEDFLKADSSLKIFWWNIGCALTNRILVKDKKQPDSLYTNIQKLAEHSSAPEIFILGEHCPGLMPSKTLKALERTYPHRVNLEKTNKYSRTRNGLWIFSKWPLEKVRQRSLEVNDAKFPLETTARTYLLLKVKHPEEEFYLSPVHLYNPWGQMPFHEVLTSSMGNDNVNYKQGEQLLKFLKEDIDVSTDPVVIVGDFNSAKSIMGFLSMSTYNLFATQFLDIGPYQTTFPTQSAKSLGNSYPDIIIDHMFSNTLPSGKGLRLPLKGSDHYPILFQL